MKKGARRAPFSVSRSKEFSASSLPSSSRPSLPSSPCEIPPFIGGLRDGRLSRSSALCRLARRPGCGRPRFVGLSPAPHAPGKQQLADKKMGCPTGHPLEALRKNYRFFAAFFFAPLAAFFAIGFVSSGCATQPPTDRTAVTTGGLSHPPSYQM